MKNIKKILVDFFYCFYTYLKDSILLMVIPRQQVKKIIKRKFSIYFILFIICFFSFISLILTISSDFIFHTDIAFRLPTYLGFFSIISLYCQIIIFVSVIIVLASVGLDLICSRLSKIKNKSYTLGKIYFHFLPLYGIYPLTTIIFPLLNINPVLSVRLFRISIGFYPTFSFNIIYENFFLMNVGQIFEGLIIGFLTPFIVYEIFRTKISSFLGTFIIAILFILVGGFGWLLQYLVVQIVFFNNLSLTPISIGSTNLSFHFIIWTIQNIVQISALIILYWIYILNNRKNFQKQMKWVISYQSGILFFLSLFGYLISGCFISFIELCCLIISIQIIWAFSNLISTNFKFQKDQDEYKDKWELFFLTLFLLSLAISLTAIISFFAAILAIILILFCITFSITFKYIQLEKIRPILLTIISFITVIIASTPITWSDLTPTIITNFFYELSDIFKLNLIYISKYPELLDLIPLYGPQFKIYYYAAIISSLTVLLAYILNHYKKYIY